MLKKSILPFNYYYYLNSLTLGCNSNKMVINATKSHSMLVCNPQKRNFIRDVTLNLKVCNETLSCLNSMKLLGVIVDNSLLWKDQVSQMCVKLS